MKFDIAFKILTDLYGYPKWDKNGQSIDEIEKIWEEELNGYTDAQIKDACYKLFRYRKTMTFPTISQLMAMLYDEEKPLSNEGGDYKQENTFCPELEIYKKLNPSCSFGRLCVAFQKMVGDFKVYFPQFNDMNFENGLAQSMIENGWWETKIIEYLEY